MCHRRITLLVSVITTLLLGSSRELCASGCSGCVTFKQLPNIPLGQAVLQVTQTDPPVLRVSNIGLSGQDGVSIPMAEAEGIKVDVTIDFSGTPDGSFFTLSGLRSGSSSTGITTQTISGSLKLTADFTALGTTTRKVDAYCHGTLVDSASLTSGPDVDIGPATQISGQYQCIHTRPGEATDVYKVIFIPNT